MLALTFLGTSNYQPVIYQYQDQEFETNLFPVALNHFFGPEEMYVVVTKEAYDKHFHELENELKEKLAIHPVKVPYGNGEDDLWEMFDKIVSSIPDNTELIVDVTHGFRAQPILTLSICMYLRMVKNVNIDHIVYGAFEAKESNGGKAPVWDLSPFLLLMDWNNALDKFLKSGNARELSELLRQSHQQAYKDSIKQSAFLPKRLQNVANNIQKLSEALTTVRSFESMERARGLVKTIHTPEIEEEVKMWAKPFEGLLTQVCQEYEPLAAQTKNNPFSSECLCAQFQMIVWYCNKELYQQAATLAREWVISVMCRNMGKNPAHFKEREDIAKDLGGWIERVKKGFPVTGKTKNISNQQIAELWSNLCQIRNDMNHGGHRPNPAPPETIVKKINELLDKLKMLETLC